MTKLHIVFDGPPEHEAGRFVEVENADGTGLSENFGEWVQQDEFWCLEFDDPRQLRARVEELLGFVRNEAGKHCLDWEHIQLIDPTADPYEPHCTEDPNKCVMCHTCNARAVLNPKVGG